MEKFQISEKNLNNLWSFIEIYAVFVLNLCEEKICHVEKFQLSMFDNCGEIENFSTCGETSVQLMGFYYRTRVRSLAMLVTISLTD